MILAAHPSPAVPRGSLPDPRGAERQSSARATIAPGRPRPRSPKDLASHAILPSGPSSRRSVADAASGLLAAVGSRSGARQSERRPRQMTEEQAPPLFGRRWCKGHEAASCNVAAATSGRGREGLCPGVRKALIANDSPASIGRRRHALTVPISPRLRPSGNAPGGAGPTVTPASPEPVLQGFANGPKQLRHNLLTTIRIASRRSGGTVAFAHLPLACFGNRFRAHRPQSRREFELRQSTDRQ